MLPSRNHISVNEQPKISLRLKTKHLLRRLQAFNIKHVLWSVSLENRAKHITQKGKGELKWGGSFTGSRLVGIAYDIEKER